MGGGPVAKQREETVLITLPFPEPKDFISRITKNHTYITVQYYRTTRGTPPPPEIFKDATIIITFGGDGGLPSNPKRDAPKLHWVHVLSAGVDHLANTPVFKDNDITISSSNGVAAPMIAEWVIMTALTNAHEYNRFHDQQKEHDWNKDNYSVDDFPGQRIGILGYGAIGRHVGRIAKAMGSEVYAYTATPKDTKESRKDTGYIVPGTGDPEGDVPSKWYSGLDKENLHEFLRQDLDIVVLTLPLTNDTRGLLGSTEFSILSQKKAFISNISRGAIIQTDALIAAVKAGKLRGAALDVTDPEPLPKDSELWDLPSVTVTPHISGNGNAYVGRAFALFEESLRRIEKGEKPLNVVDRRRGY